MTGIDKVICMDIGVYVFFLCLYVYIYVYKGMYHLYVAYRGFIRFYFLFWSPYHCIVIYISLFIYTEKFVY